MTTPPLPGWQSAARGASFSEPAACQRRAERFGRTIRTRNALEYVAGGLVIAGFGASSVMAATRGEWLIALALAMVVAGAVAIMRSLYTRASNIAATPEEPCLVHLRRQYQRQYEALASVPRWYIGPLLPGVVLFYVAVVARVAEAAGWEQALRGAAEPAAITFGIFAAVAVANRLAARGLARRIAALDALA